MGREVKEDWLLGRRLRVLQPTRGYRAGMDAALLAAAANLLPGQRLIEAGCGAGGALCQVAARCPETQMVGVERDAEAVRLAQLNMTENGFGDRNRIIQADIADGFRSLGLSPFDAAICNPPFFDDETSLRPPAPERRGAWIADDGLEAWTGFLLKAVREGGTITVIHRADRLADILGQLASKAGSFQIRPIHPFADHPAKRVIVRAIKTGRAPLELLPALVMHDQSGAKHTPEAEAILRGERILGWR